jgi:hypothetical protein
MKLGKVKKWSLARGIGGCVRKARQIPTAMIGLDVIQLASGEGWA